MKEYKIVFSKEGPSFDEMVSEALNDGWELYGNPWSHQEAGGSVVYLYQAIKRDITYILVEEETEEAPAEEATEEKKED